MDWSKIPSNIGFAIIVVLSAVIWLPRLLWQMAIMIGDNIREHYTDRDEA